MPPLYHKRPPTHHWYQLKIPKRVRQIKVEHLRPLRAEVTEWNLVRSNRPRPFIKISQTNHYLVTRLMRRLAIGPVALQVAHVATGALILARLKIIASIKDGGLKRSSFPIVDMD